MVSAEERVHSPAEEVYGTAPSRRWRRSGIGPSSIGRRRDLGWSLLSLILGLGLWEVTSRVFELRFFPPFSAVFERFLELLISGEIYPDLFRSLKNLGLGFAISAVAGVLIGALMGRFSLLEKALDPYIYALLTAPAVAFVPIYFTVFGLSSWAIVTLIVHYSVFIIIINTIAGVKNVDRGLVDMCRSFNATESQMLRLVVIPAALPLIMAGLRIGMARSVKAMINGELLIAVIGIGAISSRYGRAFDAVGVLAILLIVIAIALVAVGVIESIDRRVNSWIPRAERD